MPEFFDGEDQGSDENRRRENVADDGDEVAQTKDRQKYGSPSEGLTHLNFKFSLILILMDN